MSSESCLTGTSSVLALATLPDQEAALMTITSGRGCSNSADYGGTSAVEGLSRLEILVLPKFREFRPLESKVWIIRPVSVSDPHGFVIRRNSSVRNPGCDSGLQARVVPHDRSDSSYPVTFLSVGDLKDSQHRGGTDRDGRATGSTGRPQPANFTSACNAGNSCQECSNAPLVPQPHFPPSHDE
jgi:hypothetical protein